MNQSRLQQAVAGRRRRAVKQEVIIAALRRQIIDGKFPAGARLPKQQALARRFKVSVVTVQRAMERLAREGFIETRYSQGTFVVDHPPHRHRYALVFYYDPSDLSEGGWSHFYAALANEAARIQQTGPRVVECFYGIEGRPDSANYQRLVTQVEADQFAGVIFASSPHALIGTPVLERPGLPRVALMSRQLARPTLAAVDFDGDLWFEKALAHLAAAGRKRVAFVSKPRSESRGESLCPPSRLAAHGLVTRPYWRLVLPVWAPGAEHSVQLLMQQAGDRPDALVITDDNLVEPVVAGLMAAGLHVPDELEVVAHANFPRSGPSALPVTWLGYDSHEALQTCLAIIDQQRGGGKPPVRTRISPVFEEEWVNAELAASR